MPLDSEILKQILQLRSEGFEDQKIADKLKIYGTEIISQPVYAVEEIEDFIEEEITDAAEIAKRLNLPQSCIQKLASDFDLPITITTTEESIPRGKLIETIRQLQQERKRKKRKSRKQVRKYKQKITPTLESKQEPEQITAPSRTLSKEPEEKFARIEEIDERVLTGLPLKVLGKAGGLTARKTEDYLRKTGQYDLWAKHYQPQEKRNLLGNTIESIIQHLHSKADKIEQKVFYKVDEFFKKTKTRETSYETIATVYRNFYNAEEKGETSTLHQLGKGTNLWPAEVGIILKQGELEPPRGKKDRHPVPEWKIEAIERVFYSKLGAADLGHLLALPDHVISQRMIKIEKQREKKRPKTKKFVVQLPATDEHPTRPILTYKLSSKIYDWRDAGISREEIEKDFGIEKRIVDYALEHESVIAPEIIEPIQMIFPDEKVDVPYVKKEWKKQES